MNIVEKKPELRDIDTIYPYPLNAKKHEKDQVKKLAASIEKFGWRGNPILVDKFGVIIAGHGRRLAAIELGLTRVPVVVEEDMSAEEARAFRLVDNRVSLSDTDTFIFRQEIEGIDVDDLRGFFDDKELDFSLADLGEMNTDAFVDDLSAVVEEQQQEINAQVEAASSKRHPLVKAFGFKDVSCENARLIGHALAKIQSEHGVSGEEALMHVINSFSE